MPWSKALKRTRLKVWSRKPFVTWISKIIDTKWLALYLVATRENYQLQWLWSETLRLYCWTNLLQAWTLRRDALCGKLWKRFHSATRNQRSFWQLIQWKRRRPCLQSSASWSEGVSSGAWGALSTSRTSLVLDTRSKSKLLKLSSISYKS